MPGGDEPTAGKYSHTNTTTIYYLESGLRLINVFLI